jgi:hypothetical protein
MKLSVEAFDLNFENFHVLHVKLLVYVILVKKNTAYERFINN